MQHAFEDDESKGDLDMITNLIQWIYQTQDIDKLEQMLELAMTTNEVPVSPEKDQIVEKIADDTKTDLSTSVTTPAVAGSMANMEVAVLKQKMEQQQKEIAKLEEEKKLQDEEITQLNQEIYKRNEEILRMQRNAPVSPIKGEGQQENTSKDLSYSLT